MLRLLLTRALLIAFACTLAALAGNTQAATIPAPESAFVPGEIVVGLDANVSSAALTLGTVLRAGADHVTIAVPEGQEQAAIEQLSGQPGVTYAELNYLAQPQYIPDDPQYPSQWNWPVVQAPQAWDITRGEGVTIAVVDTGVAYENFAPFARSPELSLTTFVDPYDFTENDAHPNDDNGHGTHVTGTLAQDWNNGIGVAGLAPEAEIMPVKVCSSTGCPGDMMAAGIRWAVDHGAHVINMSLGGPSIPTVERSALAYAEQQGVVVVAASGNGIGFVGGPNLDYPARVASVIAAGAIDYGNDRTRYSNYGVHEGGGGLLIMAPGGSNRDDLNNDGNPDGILQNTYKFACGQGERDYTQFTNCYYQGTSMATPHVAGTVALLLSRFPGLLPGNVRDILACSAKDIGPPGPDLEYGAGLVQTWTALKDNNLNDLPDCLDPRTQLNFTAGSGSVEPGEDIVIPVDATADHDIHSYVLQLTTDNDNLFPYNCNPRPDTECFVDEQEGIVYIEQEEDAGLSGSVRLAEVSYHTKSQPGETRLAISASATVPDDFDAPPQVTTVEGTVFIKPVPETVSGDVNCDGVVNVLDVTISLAYFLEVKPAFCWQHGDIDCTGDLDPKDTLALLDYISGIDATLPSGCPADT